MKEAEAREAEEIERDCEQISEESLDESTEHAKSDAKLKGAIEGPANQRRPDKLRVHGGIEELEHEIEEEIKRDYMTSELLRELDTSSKEIKSKPSLDDHLFKSQL